MVVVENLRTANNSENVRAFATIVIANKIRIVDVKVVQQPGQEAWVAMPSRSYEQGGKRRWISLVEILDADLKEEITGAVLQEFRIAQKRDIGGKAVIPDAS